MIKEARELRINACYNSLKEEAKSAVSYVINNLDKKVVNREEPAISINYIDSASFSNQVDCIRPLDSYLPDIIKDIANFLKMLEYKVKIDKSKKILYITL